ncbi:UDP-N-acetylmuramoyl-L-alanine--D-glutamate ligase [Exiguobacterium antarcticum]|uniref:UDP-N-acetylmuramoylalanine--D-glutamate ligase n=1 Tax=Exiguobacterium antarcticum TaxID=132920 RepID=A0ABT6QYJ2_9BACL|nr:UDP-N-acetylmuramoyl-L-alanine--D-glutamate ligase [Exiguobacterium antarcticum]AFS70921.1 UDP-N-acetylmuramoylalanine--D-glutamate ligase [Exiguobacterium antarcticum B7]MDI3233766.1 UDP-N-acetylmuramoyl-L-alanine--D-glutamate ligase [Exiguobacterium antarcticum]
MKISELDKKKVLVLGTAKSGIAAATYLVKTGAVVTVNDGGTPSENDVKTLETLDVETVFGSHPLSLLEGIELIVKNPGIPYQIPLLEAAMEQGIPIWTEVELAYRSTEADWVAITGSNGKTTTTTLVHELLKRGSKRVHLAGNIGFPAVEIAQQATAGDLIVIELSSFQLMGIETFKPVSAAFLNLSPAHLDYHGDVASYGEAKARIFSKMDASGRLVVNADDKGVMRLSETAKAERLTFSRQQNAYAHVEDGMILIDQTAILPVSELALGGGHNLENVLAALTLIEPFDISLEAVQEVLRTFGGVAHRTEYIGEFVGRKVYNDSKATNNVATEAALSGFQSPIIWLCGGLERGADLTPLGSAMTHVKHVIGLGETGQRFADLAHDQNVAATVTREMEEAVSVAFDVSEPGDIILLSPASASWDQYKTYEERGEHFIRSVQKTGGAAK